MSGLLPAPEGSTDADRWTDPKTDTVWVSVTRKEQVSQEFIDWAAEEIDLRYPDRIDWEDVWDRLEGTVFADGSHLDWGNDNDSPAMRKVQAGVRKIRRYG